MHTRVAHQMAVTCTGRTCLSMWKQSTNCVPARQLSPVGAVPFLFPNPPARVHAAITRALSENTICRHARVRRGSNTPERALYLRRSRSFVRAMTKSISLGAYYTAFDRMQAEVDMQAATRRIRRTTLQNYLAPATKSGQDGFARMQTCRRALDSLDRRGWQRSFHQRMFHDCFIRACARIFWKNDPLGSFAKDHQRILEVNGWDHLSQEVLVSTPRRSRPPRQRRRVLAGKTAPVVREFVWGQARRKASGHRGWHGVPQRVARDAVHEAGVPQSQTRPCSR